MPLSPTWLQTKNPTPTQIVLVPTKTRAICTVFFGTVGNLQKAGVLQDVVLEVEGRRFPCHRLVLSAASPYFRAMFTSDMAESRQKTVVLQGLDADMLWEILSYIYSGTLHVSLDKVQPLYQAADLLQLDYVRDTCSSYMAMNVERSTCVDLYSFADTFSVKNVQKLCQDLIHRNFVEVASSEEFCSLSLNQLTEIISHDELDVKEEATVWEAVVRWVQHNREDRLHHLPSILPHIRFNLLTSDDTAAILEHPLVREEPGNSEVIRNMVQKGDPNPKPRLGMTTEMVLLHYRESLAECEEILYMNPREGKYISCSYRDLPDDMAMIVTSDNDIYKLVGNALVLEDEENHEEEDEEGDDEEDYNYQKSLCKYNHRENTWKHAGMSSVSAFKREYSKITDSLVEVDRTLYYIAVDEEEEEARAMVRLTSYNRHTDQLQWQACSHLRVNETGYLSPVLSCGPHLYFVMNSAMHCYDPSQDCWSKRTPPKLIPDVCAAVAIGTEIFCTDVDFTQTMVYDTESDRWQKHQGWPNPGDREISHCPSFFVLDNQVHILLETHHTADFDGEDEDDIEIIKYDLLADFLVYVYDRSAGAWRDLKATLPKTYYFPPGPVCPVARMYLPYLRGAQKHITSYASHR
ncbi:kelch repeat and BTB domain-containing protein 2-like [Branchiostoma floridae x Branchiostoma japonicum]